MFRLLIGGLLAVFLAASALADDVHRTPRETDFYLGDGMSQNLVDAFAVLVRRSGYDCRTLVVATPISGKRAWSLVCNHGRNVYQIRKDSDGGYTVIGR
jgi:hypothetical protein